MKKVQKGLQHSYEYIFFLFTGKYNHSPSLSIHITLIKVRMHGELDDDDLEKTTRQKSGCRASFAMV